MTKFLFAVKERLLFYYCLLRRQLFSFSLVWWGI